MWNTTNFITIFFAHSYSSICYSIDYLFKLLGGTIYFVLQWSKSPIFLYFYTVFILTIIIASCLNYCNIKMPLPHTDWPQCEICALVK